MGSAVAVFSNAIDSKMDITYRFWLLQMDQPTLHELFARWICSQKKKERRMCAVGTI